MEPVNQPPWGEYRPAGLDRLLLNITRLGLARGAVKNLVARLYRARDAQRPVDIIRHGLKWRLHPWDNSTENKILCASRQRDREELDCLREAVKNGGVFVDIGANAGYYSLMAVSFGAGQVLAVEPNPIVGTRLRFNIVANELIGTITVVAAGVGSRAGDMALILHPHDLGACSLSPGEPTAMSVRVPVLPMVDILSQANLTSIEALKIDTEGMEAEILLPFFRNTDRSNWPRLLIMEHEPHQPEAKQLLDRLQEAGYWVKLQTRANVVLRLKN